MQRLQCFEKQKHEQREILAETRKEQLEEKKKKELRMKMCLFSS